MKSKTMFQKQQSSKVNHTQRKLRRTSNKVLSLISSTRDLSKELKYTSPTTSSTEISTKSSSDNSKATQKDSAPAKTSKTVSKK